MIWIKAARYFGLLNDRCSDDAPEVTTSKYVLPWEIMKLAIRSELDFPLDGGQAEFSIDAFVVRHDPIRKLLVSYKISKGSVCNF
ncbi:uncharacterized protein PHALS_09783 [Plasmopara halstedii]|uniref:Uncharacterized protein n=1 Tax=Plasmopara halstedii TaxID=4781 RepID=A0A0P1AFP4_PLAHL|nr:uncharacterized protein PHALS_09783 [Plasmopara halstedii]CEG39541.1 hypothetical protein PHALS_09783 [Plasmopara halstedii]|eukprot:XP_024575910.1 hypothetical protein PHALS_09783 [Plasmopara halstedii]